MARQKTLSLLQTLDQLPPFVVNALARNGRGGRPSFSELAKASGLPERTFGRIAGKLSWEGVKAGQIERFCDACGINLLLHEKERNYWRSTIRHKRPFVHLSDSQLKTFNKRCEAWAAKNGSPDGGPPGSL